MRICKKPLYYNALKAGAFFATGMVLAANEAAAGEKVLEPIVVTVTKDKIAPEDVQASFSIVTAEEIRASGAKDVIEAIRRTTGVTVGANSGTTAGRNSIQIRGMDSGHVLIMVDGKRLTNTDSQISHSNFRLNPVPMDSIDHIEIVRGPMSSLYGSSGMAGVVNVVTKSAAKTWRSAVDMFYGDIDTGKGGQERKLNLSTSGPISKNAGVRISAETSEITATPDKDTGWPTIEIEGNRVHGLSTNLFYDVAPNQRLIVDFDQTAENRYRDDPYYKIHNNLGGVGYKGEVLNTSVDAKVYRAYSDTHLVDSTKPYRHYLTDWVYSIDAIRDLNESNRLIAGVEHRTEAYEKKYDSPSTSDYESQIDYSSVFAQDDISLLDDALALTLGLRYDHHENFGGEYSPKAYITYGLTDTQTVGFGYGHGFKAPTVTQSSASYSMGHGSTTYIGNAALKPETNDSFELTWEYGNNITRTRTAVFYNNIKNLIDTTTVATNTKQYTNVSTAKTKGIEFEISHPLTESIDADFNVTGMNTEDGSNDGKALQQRPRIFGNLNLTHTYAPWDLRSSFNWEYIGSQYMAANEVDPVPGYSLFDLTFVKPLNDTVELRGGVTNMFDVRLEDKSTNFGADEERGRFYFVGLRATF